mgnify:CR=1 FL=1
MIEINKHFTTRKTVLEQTPLVQEQNEQVVTTSLIVANEFGKEHRNVLRGIEGLLKNEQTHKMFQKSTYIHEQNKQEYTMYYMNRDGFTLLAMGFTGKKALQFKLKFIEQFNRMEQYIKEQHSTKNIEGTREEEFKLALTGVEYASRVLRTDTTSNIKMLETAHKEFNVTTAALPKYVDEEVTRSLTELLKEHGVSTSATKVNSELIKLGILEIKERPSKSGMKAYKSLTEEGLYYGKNLINPYNNLETQPHYYESKFPELLEQVKSSGDNVGED